MRWFIFITCTLASGAMYCVAWQMRDPLWAVFFAMLATSSIINAFVVLSERKPKRCGD